MRICSIGGARGASGSQAFARSVNQSLARQRGDAGRAARTDVARFGTAAQRKSPLQALMDQRQSLLDQKNALIEKSKDGLAATERIDKLTEQIERLDEQIGQQAILELGKTGDGERAEKDDEPKTREELEAARAKSLIEFASGLDEAEVISSVREKVGRRIATLSKELATDRAAGAGRPSRTVSAKEREIVRLEAKADQLNARLGQEMAETAGRIAGDREPPRDRGEEDEEGKTLTPAQRALRGAEDGEDE